MHHTTHNIPVNRLMTPIKLCVSNTTSPYTGQLCVRGCRGGQSHCTGKHTCTYANIHTYIHTHIYTPTVGQGCGQKACDDGGRYVGNNTHTHTHALTHTRIHTHTPTHTCIHAPTHRRAHTHTRVSQTHTCTHTTLYRFRSFRRSST